jgi:ADP-ribose pyrophosphatase YjhB (NUDIX family)
MINRNISVRAVIYKNKKIFVVRQKSLKAVTGVLDYYNMPGGKLEVNEGLKECLEREIIEELGVLGNYTLDTPKTEVYN